jgi:hypothetical protein
VIIDYRPGASRMVVFDSFLKYLGNDPVLGTVSRDTDVTFVLKWKVPNMKTSSNQNMDWRLTLVWQKKNGKASISGRAAVSDGENTGLGSCKFLK